MVSWKANYITLLKKLKKDLVEFTMSPLDQQTYYTTDN
jgi:hypothetical protein